MAVHLDIEKYDSKQKSNRGNIRKIVQDNNVEKAINNAEELEKLYKSNDILNSIETMNPYTGVYGLVKRLMIEILK